MRLREIYQKCIAIEKEINTYQYLLEDVFKILKRDNENMPQSGGTVTIIRNESAYKNFLEMFDCAYTHVTRELGDIPYFETTIRTMYSAKIAHEELEMMEMYKELQKKVACAISLYETTELQYKEDGIGLEVKLPDLNDITELKKHIDDLEFIFTKCPFFQNNDASLKLETVDSGSIWLIFAVACTSVSVGSKFLNNIVSFIDKCYVIRSHSLSCKRQELEIENAKIEQKEKEELLKNINRLYRISVENAIRDLQVITGCPIQDGEEMGRAEQSLEKMTKLLEQGLQIYASLDSPQEVKALFEPLEMHYFSAEKELKKIEKKSEKESEKESE